MSMGEVKVGDFVIASFGDWRGVWQALYKTDEIVFVTYAPFQQGNVDLVKRENQISIEQVLSGEDEAWKVIRHAK
jgi:hypothetical protein